MYSRKNLMKKKKLSVYYIFSKFDGFNKIWCDIPSGSTQLYFHPNGIFVESIQRL
jgi:hypothetical protein